MGASYMYANLFMSNLEIRLLESCALTPSVLWHYIDDIFSLWPHGEDTLRCFIEEINQFHPKIKFTPNWSEKFVTFLDVKVTIEHRRLIMDL